MATVKLLETALLMLLIPWKVRGLPFMELVKFETRPDLSVSLGFILGPGSSRWILSDTTGQFVISFFAHLLIVIVLSPIELFLHSNDYEFFALGSSKTLHSCPRHSQD